MHLEQYLHAQLVCHVHELLTLLLGQAGREVRIMVKPDVISDDQVILLARQIAKKIEDTLDYPGQIKVNVIRESRAVDYAK